MASPRILREAPLVAAAVLVAFLIWIMAKQSTLETEQVLVPIRLANVPENVDLKLSQSNVPVVVRFPQSQRSRVVSQNFEIRLDAEQVFGDDKSRPWAGVAQPQIHDIPIDLDHVHSLNLPQSVRVSELGAQRIQVEATLVTAKVPVRVVTVGQLPPDRELRAPLKAEPAEVLVTAPRETLRRLAGQGAEILTDEVRLEGREKDFIDYPTLRLPLGFELVDPSQAKVQVVVEVRDREAEKTVTDVPVTLFVYSDRLQATLTPPMCEVKIRGRITVLDRIDPSMFSFAAVEPLPEKIGTVKKVRLQATFSESAPEALRRDVQIVDFAPHEFDIRFAEAAADKSE